MPRALTSSQLAARRRRSSRWGRVALVGFIVLAIAGVTEWYFAQVHEELVSTSGSILDCGTMFAPNDLPLAAANCGGEFTGDILGFVLMAIVILAAIAAVVIGTIFERRGAWRG